MRFVRYCCHRDTGEILAVFEQETLFDEMTITIRTADGAVVPLAVHDLGLVDDFLPCTLEGNPCSPAHHLYQRALHRDEFGKLHVTPGAELPALHDCPATSKGIQQRLRERGVEGIPVKARAWLAFMLPPREVEALGVGGGVPVSVFKAFDSLRARRDPGYASRRFLLERIAQERSDRDAKVRHSRRLAAAVKPEVIVDDERVEDTAAIQRAAAEARWEAIKAAAILDAERMEAERSSSQGADSTLLAVTASSRR